MFDNYRFIDNPFILSIYGHVELSSMPSSMRFLKTALICSKARKDLKW